MRKGVAIAGGATLAAGAAAVAGLSLVAALASRRSSFALGNRVVLVSGGSRGLGFALADEFLRRGARVAICARDPAELDRALQKLSGSSGPGWGEGRVTAVAADLLQPGQATKAVREVEALWGPIEVSVHDAGIMQVGPWDQMPDSAFRDAMELHCWAALELARAVLPGMLRRREGRLVHISSIGGLVPVPHMLPYTTSKFALVGLSQGLATEVRRHGVRVTCVCPFLTRTGSQEHVELRGQHQKEFAWFGASGAFPLTSQSAAHVARAAVNACQRGQAQLTMALPGKLAALAHGVAPSAMVTALAWASRLLPASPKAPAAARTGAESYGPWTRRWIQPLIRASAQRFNEV